MRQNRGTEVPESSSAGSERRPSRGLKAHYRMMRFVVWISSGLLAAGILAGTIVVALGGRTVSMPDWVTLQVQSAMNRGIAPARVRLGGVQVTFRKGAAPSISAVGTSVYDADGRYLAYVPKARAAFDRSALLEGRILPQSLTVTGIRMLLRRDADGQFAVALGNRPGLDTIGGSPAELIDQINRLFDTRGLEVLQRIQATDVGLIIIDDMSGRRWDISQGEFSVERTEAGAQLRLTLAADGFGKKPARVALRVGASESDLGATLDARLENASAGDIAALGPSLSWLRPLEAPVSGALKLDIAPDGQLAEVHGALDIGAGRARIQDTQRTVAIRKARARFDYFPAKSLIRFSDLSLSTSAVDLSANGQMLIHTDDKGRPELVTQLQFSKLTVTGEADSLDRPAVFDKGGTDFRLRFDPFRLEVGQMSLAAGDTRIVASGRASVGEQGLTAGADLSINAISTDDFLALWPRKAIPVTRDWAVKAVKDGQLSNMRGSLRLTPDAEPVIAAGWQFRKATLRWLPQQAPITGLTGYASLQDNRLTVVANAGRVDPATGGPVDVSGTVLTIPDVRVMPATARIDLHTRGTITGQLSILDTKPFEFLKKAGRPVDLASGAGEIKGRISVRLVNPVQINDVSFDLTAALSNVSSDVVVPGHHLSAKRLAVSVSKDEGLRIAGRSQLDGVPLDGEWQLPLDPGGGQTSRLTASVEVSQRTSDRLHLGLPEGTLSGIGTGRVTVVFPPGKAPELKFFSDMNAVGIAIPALGYRKATSATGKVEAEALLTTPPQIPKVSVNVPGLRASGSIALRKDGELDRVRLDRVRIGRWFDGPVDLIGRGKTRPLDIAVLGGSFDLQTTTAGTGGGAGGEAGRMTVALDRFIITDGIQLTSVKGDFDLGTGLKGPFSGRVNGGASVTGTIQPAKHGPSVRMMSDHGGEVLRDAGLISKAQEGQLTLTLTPRTKNGFYDGSLNIKDVWVSSVPALAELLSAVSVVGLFEQLSGKGILFNDVAAKFALGPKRVVIKSSRAEGASMGLTMDGSYERETGKVDMQGVISPIYMLNGIGQLISRRGEGLIGIGYRMKGTFEEPQVTVNPLSLLTPGFLRDIFRKKVPKVGDEPDAGTQGGKAAAGN